MLTIVFCSLERLTAMLTTEGSLAIGRIGRIGVGVIVAIGRIGVTESLVS